MSLVSQFYKIARVSNRMVVFSSFNPERILKYFVNKNIFKLTSKMFLRTRKKKK